MYVVIFCSQWTNLCLFMRDTYYHWSWGLWGPIEVVLGAQHNQILGNRVYFLSVDHVLKDDYTVMSSRPALAPSFEPMRTEGNSSPGFQAQDRLRFPSCELIQSDSGVGSGRHLKPSAVV